MRVGEDNFDQEGNEMITCVFSVDGTVFVCIDNRILQMSYTNGKKMIRTYYPNMSYIIDAAVSNNSVALCNLRGRIIFLIWSEEQKKLQQRACYNINNCLLRQISFLDNEQAKVSPYLFSTPANLCRSCVQIQMVKRMSCLCSWLRMGKTSISRLST